ncbi:hypothetical protein SCMC78_31510 [Streptomyces sp. CMC78]|uniref:Uncharacterized protein n=1 Tax=Streptomyces sp. CMC78 TaxID=3231512 RepID=A0AB33KCM6_9ACTN
MDNPGVVNNFVTQTSDFRSAALWLHTVTRRVARHPARTIGPATARQEAQVISTPKTRPDMRRPPPGGRAGVVPTADSGGEESDRVSTVANDP